jgi:hypothetical protein
MYVQAFQNFRNQFYDFLSSYLVTIQQKIHHIVVSKEKYYITPYIF